MAWDIYGNKLKRGYCEVHPSVPEDYPCYICERERERDQEQRDEYEQQQAFIREHYEQQERQMSEDAELQIVSGQFKMIDKIINQII